MPRLSLTRRPGDQILIGPDVTLIVHSVGGNKVTLCFDAPAEVEIWRAELGKVPAADARLAALTAERDALAVLGTELTDKALLLVARAKAVDAENARLRAELAAAATELSALRAFVGED